MANEESLTDPDTAILIVDDSVQFSGVLNKLLTQALGYRNVTVISDTVSAYELVVREPKRFRLLFVDFRFPEGTTGGDLLVKLSREGLLEGKFAFLITSEPSPDNVRQAADAGAVGVVAKPFDRAELKRQIEKAEALRRTQAMESF